MALSVSCSPKVSEHEVREEKETLRRREVSVHEVHEEMGALLSLWKELKEMKMALSVSCSPKVSEHEVREEKETLRRREVSVHEVHEEMGALLSLWKELKEMKYSSTILCDYRSMFIMRRAMYGLGGLNHWISLWEFAVQALLLQWVLKFEPVQPDFVPVFNESQVSEVVKLGEYLVSEFRESFNLDRNSGPFILIRTVANNRVEVRLKGVHGGGGGWREEIMVGGEVVLAIPGIINRDRDEGIGRGIGGEGNGDEDRGRGRDVEDRRGEGNSWPKMDSSRKAETYTDRDCDPAPHTGGPTIPFGISQASGSGRPVEGQGESSGGQDGGIGAGSQVEGSDGGIGGEGDGDEGIGGGIGGGGQGEGNGDEGGDEGRGRVGDVEIGRRERNSRQTKLPEIFIAVSAQSTAAAAALHFLGLSSGARGLLVSVLVTNLVGFVCCTAALWQSHTSPRASGILGRIGSAATSLGFILMIAMILPPYLLWIIVLACLALLAVFILSFMS